jgi:hypothetical protein
MQLYTLNPFAHNITVFFIYKGIKPTVLILGLRLSKIFWNPNIILAN